MNKRYVSLAGTVNLLLIAIMFLASSFLHCNVKAGGSGKPVVPSEGIVIKDEAIRGNGQIKTETRQVSAFSELSSSGKYEVQLEHAGREGLKIEADANLLPYIESFNEGKALVIRFKKGYELKPSGKRGIIKLYVQYKNLAYIRGAGSGMIFTKNQVKSDKISLDLSGGFKVNMDMDVSRMDLNVSGASEFSATGVAKQSSYNISGRADIRSSDLRSDDVFINVAGNTKAYVTAEQELSANISGRGSVFYKGSPKVKQSILGAGAVRRQD